METDTGPREWRGTARFVRPAGIRSERRDWLAAGAVPIEPVSSLHFGQMQGDFRKMQGGGNHDLAKSHQISIAWDGVSQASREEQGAPSLLSRVLANP